jgi:hypothetical protein
MWKSCDERIRRARAVLEPFEHLRERVLLRRRRSEAGPVTAPPYLAFEIPVTTPLVAPIVLPVVVLVVVPLVVVPVVVPLVVASVVVVVPLASRPASSLPEGLELPRQLTSTMARAAIMVTPVTRSSGMGAHPFRGSSRRRRTRRKVSFAGRSAIWTRELKWLHLRQIVGRGQGFGWC